MNKMGKKQKINPLNRNWMSLITSEYRRQQIFILHHNRTKINVSISYVHLTSLSCAFAESYPDWFTLLKGCSQVVLGPRRLNTNIIHPDTLNYSGDNLDVVSRVSFISENDIPQRLHCHCPAKFLTYALMRAFSKLSWFAGPYYTLHFRLIQCPWW